MSEEREKWESTMAKRRTKEGWPGNPHAPFRVAFKQRPLILIVLREMGIPP